MSYDNQDAAPMPCCVLLRSKTMYFNAAERPGHLCFSDEQTYWCTCTQGPEGPDDAEASPPKCQPGRACYKADE